MSRLCFYLSFMSIAANLSLAAASVVTTANGQVQGTASRDAKVRIFKGIPFAAPPVGPLRWKLPQPPANWSGIRHASEFGPRCMQAPVFNDMIFRDKGPSEDCLYLNVWTPAVSATQKLPVMVWIYGGGFVGGAASEPRQDGEHLAKKGVVVVSMNYRLGIFGFFAHPELAAESGRNAAGNYGLFDQAAALGWVQKNIAAFGGDPEKVTIFGESAGSFSVSAQMASPLTVGLFQKAIGESGAFFGPTLTAKTLARSEEDGANFAQSIHAPNLAALRAMSAAELLKATTHGNPFRFTPTIDGYFLPEDAYSIYAAGKQRHVPLLAGWNADEGSYHSIFGKKPATLENYKEALREKFGDKADEVLKAYPASNDEQAKRAAQDLAGDQFTGYSTWKWLNMQSKTGAAPVYRYHFEDALPLPAGETNPDAAWRGAYHSSEIEFVFDNLDYKNLPWRPKDRKLSEQMSSYWSNFAKTGDPNGTDLPHWPTYDKDDGYQVMHLNADPHATPEQHRQRYELLDSMTNYSPAAK